MMKYNERSSENVRKYQVRFCENATFLFLFIDQEEEGRDSFGDQLPELVGKSEVSCSEVKFSSTLHFQNGQISIFDV